MLVGGETFTGEGEFKFALVDAGTETSAQATATATVTAGFITGITINNSGSGYINPPLVLITDGSGIGAAATTTVSGGQVSSILVNSAGSGYSDSPIITIDPPSSNREYVTFWSNDGTSADGDEPTFAVSISVIDGLFTAPLGDDTVPNMTPIPSSVFDNEGVHLRIWFNDGVNGFAHLNADFNITSTAFAIRADHSTTAQSATTADSAASVGWSNINGIPAGFADALDNDTTYAAGGGIKISGTTISNLSPDRTVGLTGSGATSVSGSYPNFNVSSTDNINDADANPNNEIQALSLAGTNLSLSSGGGTVSLSPFVSPWTTSGANIYRTSGNIGIGTTSPVTALQVYANRDILGGSSMSGNGAKLIWDYSSRAFRAGYAAASSWNEDTNGLYSAGFGFGSVASAYMSFATGFYTHANTYAGFSIGRYNVGASGSPTSWTTSDPLFEVGNGTSNSARNNAFTIRKDGHVGLNDATPDYLLDIENPDLSMRSIYINHDNSTSSSTMYGVYVNADNTASNSGVSYGAYFDMTNNNDDAYGQYSLAFCDATDGSPAYAVRSYVDNDNGNGWAYSIYGSVAGSTTGSKYAGYFNGNVYTTGSYLPSDTKLKTAMQPAASSTDRLMKLQVTDYEYSHTEYQQMNLPRGPQTGLVAQDVELHFPELVHDAVQPATTPEEQRDGAPISEDIHFKAVDYARFVPHVIKTLQEQQVLIEELRAELERLQARQK